MLRYSLRAFGDTILPEEQSTIYEKISEWLDIYHSTDSAEEKTKVKNLIVEKMTPVVKYIARTIARRATDPIDDLVQAGFIGLLKAIDHYSKERNDNFRVYAGYLIIGEMKHYLRDKLNTIRVPRHIQELSIRINNFTRDLTAEELERLTSEDVASALQISTKAVDFALQMDRRRSTLSLDDIFNDDDSLSYEELLADKNYKLNADIADNIIVFKDIVKQLPADQQFLINLYYEKGMSQKEIADKLMLSQMTVSRKMKKLFHEIYQMMEEKNKLAELEGSDESGD